MFTYMAADGKTTLHGLIQLPVELRSERRSIRCSCRVYGGPGVGEQHGERDFVAPSALTEYGFLVLQSRLARGAGHGQAVRSTRSI